MTEEPDRIGSSLGQARERAVKQLTAHFADDRIDEGELERRLDLVYRARSPADLQALLSDLPAMLTGSAGTHRPLARHEEIAPRQTVVAVMGGTSRKGNWIPARKISALALMGGVELDFREARFGPGVTELDLAAIMGGIEVTVPPDLRVECEGFGILGGFEGISQVGAPDDPEQPTLRIRGMAIMGGIEVTQRLAGETKRQKRRRLREEARNRPRLEGGDRGG